MSSSVGSSNYFNVSSSANKGVSGMVSGLDTDSMVKQMLSGTQGKIDKQNALKQQTEWKVENYRDVISTINSFSSKYFNSGYGASSINNFASNDFFGAMTSVIKSGSAVKILGTTASALEGNINVAVKQLATKSSIKSSVAVSGGQKISASALDMDTIEKQFSKVLELKVGSTDVSVNLNNVNTDEGMVDAINNAFDAAGVSGVNAKMFEGKLRIIADDPATTIEVGEASTTKALTMTGLETTNSVTEIKDLEGNTTGVMLQAKKSADAEVGLTFDLEFDGVKKSITLNTVADASGNITAESVHQELNKQVTKLFGGSVTTSLINNGGEKSLEFSLNVGGEPGHELTITGLSSDVGKLGFKTGSSTHINTSSKLSELGLAGDQYSFEINGTSFTFSSDDKISNLINTINKSDAGVKISYSALSDSFSMESTQTGANFGITMSQSEGNLLSKIFGSDKVANSSSVVSKQLTTSSIAGELDDSYKAKSASLKMNVNGTDYTFSLKATTDDQEFSKAEIETRYNEWLREKFGTSNVDGVDKANISYEDGKLNIAEGYIVKFKQTDVDLEDSKAVEAASKTDLALAFGFNTQAKTNIVSKETSLSDIAELQGLDLRNSEGGVATSLEDISSVNGMNVTFLDGRLKLTQTGTVDFSDNAQLTDLFGGSSFELSNGAQAADAVTAGQDAKVIVNGTEFSRSNNVFSVEGISLELTSVSEEKLDADGNVIGYNETVIGASHDIDSIVDSFKAFVDDYNKMIEKLNKYVDADPNYRKYAPLTSAQKDEMSDDEIEKWTAKSKEGLLYRDDSIDTFLSKMRGAMYSKPKTSNLALYSMGIETTTYENKGKLVIDEDMLRTALTSNIDSVKELFLGEGGLTSSLTKIIDETAKVSAANPGILVSLAGSDNLISSQKNNTLYKQIKSIEDRLEQLNDRYESERTRYWNQFNQLESIISQYNNQSSYISNMFSNM